MHSHPLHGSMPHSSSLDWILPLLPTYRDLLNYKNVLHYIERAKVKLSVEAALHTQYPDSTQPPPVPPPFCFTWSHLNSLLPRVSKRLALLVAKGEVDGTWPPEQQREEAWRNLRQCPSRQSAVKGRKRGRPSSVKHQGEAKQDGPRVEEQDEKQKEGQEDEKEEAKQEEQDNERRQEQLEEKRAERQQQRDEDSALQQQAERLQEQLHLLQQAHVSGNRQLSQSQAQLQHAHRQRENSEQQLVKERDVVIRLRRDVQQLSARLAEAQQETEEKLKLRLLQGYIMRACHEFTVRCPNYDRLLLDADKLKQVTLEEAHRLLSCVQAFSTFSASPDHMQLSVDASTSKAQVKKVFRQLSVMVHPDKLPADIAQDSRGRRTHA
jgi:hypothetical protein